MKPHSTACDDACASGRIPVRRGGRLAAVLCGLAALWACGVMAAPARGAAASDELLVGLRAGSEGHVVHAFWRAQGVAWIEDLGPGLGVARIRVPARAMAAVSRRLARRPEVRFVARNDVVATALVPSDPQYTSQWHLPHMRVPQAWDLSQGGANAVIAIVDSGVDPYHPDLQGKLVRGANTVAKTESTADQLGHGTKMAGIAGARTNDGVGIAGVAGQSPIMPIRVTDRAGRATSASISKGIVWAADHGARVVNVSLEGIVKNPAILAAAEYAFNRGTLVVAPSGNCGCDEPAPDTPYILSVAATDEHDRVASFSSRGAMVDVAAPGTNIATTAMYGLYLSDSGSSVASSIVAGVAALMFAANPALTPARVARLLEETAVGGPAGGGRDDGVGHGRVDAYAAVQAAVTSRTADRVAGDLPEETAR